MRTYSKETGLLVVLAKGIILMMRGDLFLEDLLVLTSHLVWVFTVYVNRMAFIHSWQYEDLRFPGGKVLKCQGTAEHTRDKMVLSSNFAGLQPTKTGRQQCETCEQCISGFKLGFPTFSPQSPW